MTPDLICALIVTGAYFVCDAFGMFDHVFYRTRMFQAHTDETGHAYERPVMTRLIDSYEHWPDCTCKTCYDADDYEREEWA